MAEAILQSAITRKLWVLLAMLFALLFAHPSRACMVCIPFPEETTVDKLLRADVVVLARENPDKPFSYRAEKIIKGELESLEIDLFVNSSLRRRLQMNPERYSLLARVRQPASAENPSADGQRGEWLSLGYATQRIEAIAREVLVQAANWHEPGGSRPRARYFMPYLADAERSVRELAYLEIGKSSYDTIREANRYVTSDQIYRFLSDPLYLEWQRLYILLLGFEATEGDASTVRATMSNYAKGNNELNLSAWATALIEIDGVEGVTWLQQHYLGNPNRGSKLVLEVVKAMSVHGARKTTELREPIAEAYAALISTHPDLAGWVARDLTAWQDWRLAVCTGGNCVKPAKK